MKYRDLLPEEAAALQAFADEHGRKWKDELANVYWYNARIWTGGAPGMGNELHSIRNEFGPTWLYDHCRIKPVGKRRHVERVKPLERNPWRDF